MPSNPVPMNERIYLVVQQIPPGKVATYGQIASIVGGCTARMVGHAMAATPEGRGIPWQRVINAQGKISPRANSAGTDLQRTLLEEEGVRFSEAHRVNFKVVRWDGPPVGWLIENGYDPAPSWREK